MTAAAEEVVLPDEQLKQYPPAIMEGYLARFGLTQLDLKVRGVRYLLKGKIDADIFIEAQKKTVASLEAKVTALLAFVGKYSHLKPRKVAHAPEKNA
jgi:hypothetical protein